MSNICGKTATIEYIWAGKPHRACLWHANQIATLGQFLGQPITAKQVVTDEVCQTGTADEGGCKNE